MRDQTHLWAESYREIHRARESDPLSAILRVMEGYVLYYGRRYDQAHSAMVLAASGKKDEARRLLAPISGPGPKGQPLGPVWMAALHASLGDIDEAMTWLERTYAERSVGLVQLKVHPRFDPLRSDPRFQELMRRMKFPAS